MEIAALKASYCVRARCLSHLRVLARALSVLDVCRIYAGMWPSPKSSGSDLSH
jgi:hypothetical protein